MKKYSFRRWLRNWLNNLDEEECKVADSIRPARLTVSSDDSLDNPIRMNIYSASGGFVIETKTYDRHKDRTNSNLYIVNDGADLGEEMGKIITMTALTR